MTRTKTLAGLFAVFALCASWSANAATLSPSSVTFAATKLSTASAASTLTFTNNSDVLGVTVSSVTISGTNAGDYSIDASSTCKTTPSVAFNGTCTVKVIFTPQALTASDGTGPRTATVTVTSNSLANPSLASTLSGTSPAPVATASQSALSFPNTVTNASSAAMSYTLNNGGGVNDLSGVSIAVGGTNAGDFTQTNNCAATVAAGSSCTINVTFKPTATGARSGSIVVSSGNGGSATTTLSGNGVTPLMLALSPTSLTFTSQTMATTSAAQSVTLSNNGQTPLTVSSITLSGSNAGDFAQTNTCGNPVAAGGNCTINVTFTPTTAGTRSASVVVVSNGGNGNVTLTGTGIAPNTPFVTLSPTSLNFPNQAQNTTSAAKTVTLSNTGNAPLTVGTMSFTGANAGDFAQTNNCTTVNAGSSCAINVTFTPTSLGNRSAMLNINSNASSSPNSVALSGSTVSSSKAVTLADGRVVTLLSSQGTIDSLTVAATPTSGLPAGVTYPVGFFNYQVSGVTGGSTVTFSYVLPVGAVANTYVKCVAGTCSPLTGSNSSADGRTVTFTIQDNGPNDSNATLGVITDPGAPGVIANTNSTATVTTADSSSGAMGVQMLLLMGVPALLLSRRRKQLGSDPN